MPELLKFFLGEFFGTALLIILGNGVCAAMSYKNMFAASKGGNWVPIALGWGMAVLLGVLVANAFGTGGHLNPAVTVAFTISGATAIKAMPIYIVAQFAGAMFGQVILNLVTYKHIQETDQLVVRGCHATGPAYPNAIVQNLGMEFLGTVILIGTIMCLGLGANNMTTTFGPLIVMIIVMSIGFSLGSTTGYAINPARDAGPRLVFMLMQMLPLKGSNKTSANWAYGWIPVVSPILAGAVLGLLARFVTLA
ncbi:MIP/aquaporin family protein [Mycoplasma crocodyli]|uniref:Glycerol uptake facilitator protein n=1 Tax=Mycoplasma crocodyli (strain ATCC 51981 / MP145) TaxID=512564 RepID=D5E6H1_MYCCM|nr:MIP/aquaporin family protein [Mycoplasma crocodyli]ADE19665.1 glycerol uptake facilitator protein [Mycoplasma crocodyli MP145]